MYLRGYSVNETVETLGNVSPATCYRVIGYYNDFSTVSDPFAVKSTGRRRLIENREFDVYTSFPFNKSVPSDNTLGHPLRLVLGRASHRSQSPVPWRRELVHSLEKPKESGHHTQKGNYQL
jgi:hypothetical protein